MGEQQIEIFQRECALERLYEILRVLISDEFGHALELKGDENFRHGVIQPGFVWGLHLGGYKLETVRGGRNCG